MLFLTREETPGLPSFKATYGYVESLSKEFLCISFIDICILSFKTMSVDIGLIIVEFECGYAFFNRIDQICVHH